MLWQHKYSEILVAWFPSNFGEIIVTHHCFTRWLPFASNPNCVLDALTHCPRVKITHYNDIIIITVFMTQSMGKVWALPLKLQATSHCRIKCWPGVWQHMASLNTDVLREHYAILRGQNWTKIFWKLWSISSRVGNSVPAWNVSLWLLWRVLCDQCDGIVGIVLKCTWPQRYRHTNHNDTFHAGTCSGVKCIVVTSVTVSLKSYSN